MTIICDSTCVRFQSFFPVIRGEPKLYVCLCVCSLASQPHYVSLCDVYLTAMRFVMIIISALASYFLCDLDQQKKSKIAAVEDTVDKQ